MRQCSYLFEHIQITLPVKAVSFNLTIGRLKLVVSRSLRLIKDLVNSKSAHTGRYGPLDRVSSFVTQDGGTNGRQN